MTDKTLRDLKWFYATLQKGGKTAEFYEAQAPIICDTLKKLEDVELQNAIKRIAWAVCASCYAHCRDCPISRDIKIIEKKMGFNPMGKE